MRVSVGVTLLAANAARVLVRRLAVRDGSVSFRGLDCGGAKHAREAPLLMDRGLNGCALKPWVH